MRTVNLSKTAVALLLMFASFGSYAFWSIRQEGAYLLGEEEYVYGFPLVLMDVTRQVITAASKSGEYAAPINQFARIRTYVSPLMLGFLRQPDEL